MALVHKHQEVDVSVVAPSKKVTNKKECLKLLNDAEQCIKHLREWQIISVSDIPKYKNELPDNVEKIETEPDLKNAFLNYIKMRLLFAFANILWERISILCGELHDCTAVDEEKQNELQKLVSIVENVPVSEIVEDNKTGYNKLNSEVEGLGFLSLDVMEHFRTNDISVVIFHHNYERLFEVAVSCKDPKEPNIILYETKE